MFRFLKQHPFAVEAFFDYSLVLTFAVPKEELMHLIPECLELDTFSDKFAFVAVAMVQTKGLRPKRLPRMFGRDFFLTGYRVFVRYTNSSGKRLRGLYIIRSQTDKKLMKLFGNLFTHYHYTTTDIHPSLQGDKLHIYSNQSGFDVKVVIPDEIVSLPSGSPFSSWKEARRFAGPLPFTFTWTAERKEVLLIEGVREHWDPKPVKVLNAQFSFIDEFQLKEIVLANAFIIKDIPYSWKKGKVEKWSK